MACGILPGCTAPHIFNTQKKLAPRPLACQANKCLRATLATPDKRDRVQAIIKAAALEGITSTPVSTGKVVEREHLNEQRKRKKNEARQAKRAQSPTPAPSRTRFSVPRAAACLADWVKKACCSVGKTTSAGHCNSGADTSGAGKRTETFHDIKCERDRFRFSTRARPGSSMRRTRQTTCAWHWRRATFRTPSPS